MDDIHGAHCTPGIVEHPLFIKVQVLPPNLLFQFLNDVAHNSAGIISMGSNGTLGKVMEMAGF
jgi:hypothetical protein